MLKWVGLVLGALVVLVAGTLAALPWLVNTPRVRAQAAQAAAQALGRPVVIGSVSLRGLPTPTLRLRGIEVAEDPRFGGAAFLLVEEGRMSVRLRPLLSGRVELTDLVLERARVDLVEDRGHWNVETLGPTAAPARPGARPAAGEGSAAYVVPLISVLRVVDGAVQYRRRGHDTPVVRFERVNVTVVPSVRGAAVELKGDAVGEPGGVSVRVVSASLGAAPGRGVAEAPIKATLEVEAPEVGALAPLAFASPRVAGRVRGTLEVSGTVGRPVAVGEMRAERLTITESRPRCAPPTERTLGIEDVRAPLSLSSSRAESAPARARLGGGTISLHARIAWHPTPLLRLSRIEARGVEASRILGDYLCQPYAVSGPLEFTGEATIDPRDAWRTLGGSGRFRVAPGRLTGSGTLALLAEAARLGGVAVAVAEGTARGLTAPAPAKFESLDGSYRVTQGVVSVDDLVYRATGLTVTATGTYGLVDGRVEMAVTAGQGATQVRGRLSGVAGSLRIIATGATIPERGAIRRLLDRLMR